jgi:acetyltransferase-like isoleucine patch superfamily enzyme
LKKLNDFNDLTIPEGPLLSDIFFVLRLTGKNCIISLFDNLLGPGVCVCTGTHQVSSSDRKEASSTYFARPIIIESDYWIDAKVTIFDSVHIGAGSTVAAGTVITNNIAPGCLFGGVPAKFIRALD